MSDKRAFERAMGMIAAENEAGRQRELAEAARLKKKARVRGYIATSLWLATFATAFYYHKELQQFASEKFLAAPNPTSLASGITGNTNSGSTGQSLKLIQEQASRRDEILAETTK